VTIGADQRLDWQWLEAVADGHLGEVLAGFAADVEWSQEINVGPAPSGDPR